MGCNCFFLLLSPLATWLICKEYSLKLDLNDKNLNFFLTLDLIGQSEMYMKINRLSAGFYLTLVQN